MMWSQVSSARRRAMFILLVTVCGFVHINSFTFCAPSSKFRISTRPPTILELLTVAIVGMPNPATASNWVSVEGNDLWQVRAITFGLFVVSMFMITKTKHAHAFFRNLQAEREAALRKEAEEKQKMAALGVLGIGTLMVGMQAIPMAATQMNEIQKNDSVAEVAQVVSQNGATANVQHGVQTAISQQKAQAVRDAKAQKFQHSEEAQRRHKVAAVEEAKKAEIARRQAEAEAETNPLEDLMRLGFVCAAFVTLAEKKTEPDSTKKSEAGVEEPVPVGP